MSSPNTHESSLDESARAAANGLSDLLAASPEAPTTFAQERVRWVRRWLDELGERPASVLDFGCGAGTATRYFFDELRIRSFIGVDVSREKLAAAEQSRSHVGATYVQLGDYRATESIELAFANGVFHQLPVRARMAAAVLVYRSLKAGGLFAFWEYNPWNPGSRLALNRGRVNADTSPLNPPQARQLLRGVGFDIVQTTSAFYFPRAPHWCRPIEAMLAPLPLGREYMVLARKP